MKDDIESGGAYLRIDDETGNPFWELWGADWKDTDKMEVGNYGIGPERIPARNADRGH